MISFFSYVRQRGLLLSVSYSKIIHANILVKWVVLHRGKSKTICRNYSCVIHHLDVVAL